MRVVDIPMAPGALTMITIIGIVNGCPSSASIREHVVVFTGSFKGRPGSFVKWNKVTVNTHFAPLELK
ncbi:hypothetical protein ES703_108212 [subsurface metagenome]